MRALITGSDGFVGPYLRDALTGGGHAVTGFDIIAGGDVRDYEDVYTAIRETEPDQIFHLAAVSWPRESLSDPRRCMDINITGALNVLEAVRHTGSHAKVLLAGTSEEYGYEGRDGGTLTEQSLCCPTTPYGVSKLAAAHLGMTYARRFGLHVVATRAFNHTGWGRQACNAESAFARRIIAVERGEAQVVEHGDLSAHRSFADVRDIVRGYRMVIGCTPGIYNIGSPSVIPMSYVMDILVKLSGTAPPMKLAEGLGSKDQGAFPAISVRKIADACGWAPEIPLEETLMGLLQYWRQR